LLATLELSLRVFLSIPLIASRIDAGREDLDEDFPWRLSWIRRHQNGTDIYYTFDIYDPTKGWFSKPNLRDVQVFGNKILNTNSRGLGKTEYSYDKHSQKVRILILGDSFTFGDEVSDNETYSSYLQAMLPNAEVINMGVHGYGHDQMLILLQEENKMVEVCDSIQAIPMFIYLPARWEITAHAPLIDGEKFLFSLCQTNGKVRCFSARPYFAKGVEKGIKFALGHWNPPGHLAVAEAISDYLINEEYVPPSETIRHSAIAEPK
jgi:hypothetical protein